MFAIRFVNGSHLEQRLSKMLILKFGTMATAGIISFNIKVSDRMSQATTYNSSYYTTLSRRRTGDSLL
ncbi:hypothetical protein Ptr902_07672 [Pyrenophora tritici-repentis]|uniref:Uncharacterized protein n=1 Tax=Pyrenophora tritici-repentis TaxID=45151 RepID=A0A317APG7_9PLEO|nr:hypothetical protein PtrM4_082710 [Pyrenophora tritici-repentis]KAI0569162.1 hypothetical protein Alg130_11765 [Pyrenophora tritici-repentis]KAI0604073.1 hypothetical protein TUN205_11681 [Pyrenophora tritici-repentis]KAI0616318.1 hypothetical protein TUN199_11689 [Pyrenophora tritici-repentis]KAI1671449.1 hypothetical protein L13192_04806 [Pyrenophora tritici-repentis]